LLKAARQKAPMLAHDQQPGPGRSGLSTAVWAAALAAVIGFVSVYVTLGRPDNAGLLRAPASPEDGRPVPAAPKGPGSNALSQGQMAAFVFRKAPEPLPAFSFQDSTGRERSLSDWRGKVVLLNLWATWCLPCRKEMPALDRLQAELASDRFEVVAVSVDRKGLQAAQKFLDEAKVGRLALYADPSAQLASTLRVVGLPATLLIDAEGREIGRLLGPAEWDGDDAKRLIRAAGK
jgi:thiol-disulfide isomerase/thioredoxin